MFNIWNLPILTTSLFPLEETRLGWGMGEGLILDLFSGFNYDFPFKPVKEQEIKKFCEIFLLIISLPFLLLYLTFISLFVS